MSFRVCRSDALLKMAGCPGMLECSSAGASISVWAERSLSAGQLALHFTDTAQHELNLRCCLAVTLPCCLYAIAVTPAVVCLTNILNRRDAGTRLIVPLITGSVKVECRS